jgi:hypothetical protein
LLVNGWTDAQVRREYQFDDLQIGRLRDRLVVLELIEPLPRRRHRLLVGRRVAWRSDAPVRRAYERRVQAEFLHAAFGTPAPLLTRPISVNISSMGLSNRVSRRAGASERY